MIVYTSINTGQYSKRFIGYFKSSLSFLAVQGKMAFCCVFFFNVKSNGKIRHFSIHKDDICSRKKKTGKKMEYFIKQSIRRPNSIRKRAQQP